MIHLLWLDLCLVGRAKDLELPSWHAIEVIANLTLSKILSYPNYHKYSMVCDGAGSTASRRVHWYFSASAIITSSSIYVNRPGKLQTRSVMCNNAGKWHFSCTWAVNWKMSQSDANYIIKKIAVDFVYRLSISFTQLQPSTNSPALLPTFSFYILE